MPPLRKAKKSGWWPCEGLPPVVGNVCGGCADQSMMLNPVYFLRHSGMTSADQSMMLNPVYFLRHSGMTMPSGV